MNNILIGITGYKRTGKDTAYGYLCKSFPGYHPYHLSFADALKQELAEATGGSVKVINSNKHTPEVRKLLQWWGTDLRRELYGKNYWIEKVAKQYKNLPAKGTLAIVTDCRFVNEAVWVKSEGGFILRIFRPNTGGDMHPSERSVDKVPWDFSYTNDNTFGVFEFNMKMIANQILEKVNKKES